MRAALDDLTLEAIRKQMKVHWAHRNPMTNLLIGSMLNNILKMFGLPVRALGLHAGDLGSLGR